MGKVRNTIKGILRHKKLQKAYTSFRYPIWIIAGLCILVGSGLFLFERHYQYAVYPNVYIDGVSFGGQTPKEVEAYWQRQNDPFPTIQFELVHTDMIATLSGAQLNLGYDAALSAKQAYLIGRSPTLVSNLYQKFVAPRVDLTPYFRWNTDVVDSTIDTLATSIDVPVVDALFQFSRGRVTAFKPSKDGRKVNREHTKKLLEEAFYQAAKTNTQRITIALPIETLKPQVTTDNANSFGVKELIGRGYSEFSGSIPGRIHNVALAASRVNGVLIKPGDTFSFNDTIGDISAATGYQSAYIIKDGKTVLGDGGGVCQVSSTLFRAALNAGLPIVQRQSHAYRVHYYEDGGFKAGLDATVFAPSVDLRFKNDTPGYILIQAKPDTKRLTLEFEFYGTNDGRKAQITNHQVWGITPPPPDLYQDDPTLPKGAVKQVDFAAWGAKASFEYHVTRNGQVLQNTKFTSNYRPWQAVFLRGPQ